MKKQVIAYVHFHWDREWYREFEIFRMRLLRAFDNVLNLLETNKLPSFYFDGQTSALLDYLEIRPKKEPLIRQLIKDKRLFIGPFYCLVDEFLTDENCFRKNLEIGLKISKDFGCEDFIAYFADTFGHSASTIPILKDFGIDKAVVWRGCGDIPSEFDWKFNGQCLHTVNLVRGYFNDIFSAPVSIDKKAGFLKSNLDKISEKSGDVLLMPVGADHLGVEPDLSEQINAVNNLLEDYEIKTGTIFEYFETVKNRFSGYETEGELRDNSKTFILEGSYSSRLDIKRYNTEASYKLDLADRMQKFYGSNYSNLIEYAYKTLLQNQAHDSICGCSTDDVHLENIVRYKKIIQIADNIIEELKFRNNNNRILNLSDEIYSGVLEFKSSEQYPYQIIKTENGFDSKLLCDTQRIPITEDYTKIYTYCVPVKNITGGLSELIPDNTETDVFITDKCIGNSKIFLSIENNKIKAGDKEIKFVDWKDSGDSYNFGPDKSDNGTIGKLLSSKVLYHGTVRSALKLKIDLGDVLDVEVSLDKESEYLNFKVCWENTHKNHLIQFVIDTNSPITKTYSEDMENIIERTFEPDYDIRQNLPETKGVEAKSNNAPMHRGVCANNTGIVTKGITQYEVFKSELRIPLLRASGVISNPENTSRTTPAGPPIEVSGLQQIGYNQAEFAVFFGDNLSDNIRHFYTKCLII